MSENNNPGLIFCPVCGKQISSDAPACPHCGHPFNAAEPPKKKSVAKKVIIILLIIFVLIPLIIYILASVIMAQTSKYVQSGTKGAPQAVIREWDGE